MKINDKRDKGRHEPRQGEFVTFGERLYLVIGDRKYVSLPDGFLQCDELPKGANVVDVEINILKDGR